MFLLQVLDASGSSEASLGSARLVIGSAADAGLRLSGAGVVAEHARIEVVADKAHVIALDGEVRVNGRAVERAAIALGDRIELGSAVLVVAAAVSRPSSPDDVLSGAARARREPRAATRSQSGSGKLVVAAAAGVVAVGAALFFLTAGGSTSLPPVFAELDRLRRAGSFELARTQAAQLDSWAVDDARRALVQKELQRIADMEQRVQRRKDAILKQASGRTYAEFSDELKRDERSAKEEDERIAARIVRSGLTELLRGAVAKAPPPPAEKPIEKPASKPAPADPSVSKPAPSQSQPAIAPAAIANAQQPERPAPSDAPTPALAPTANADTNGKASQDDVAAAIAQAMDSVARSEFAQAIAQLELALGVAAASDRDRLAQQVESIRAAAKAQMEQVLNRARNESDQGRIRSGIDALAEASPRFPATGPFAAIPALLDELRRRESSGNSGGSSLDVASEAARRRTLEQLAPSLIRIRALETEGDFAGARVEIQKAADSVRESDREYATRLDLRSADLDRVMAWHDEVGKLVAAAPIEVALVDRGTARIVGVAGSLLRVAIGGAEENVSWFAVDAQSIAQIEEGAKLTPAAALGAASLLYRADARRLAERALARAFQQDKTLAQEIWRTLAHGRGEPVDPRGYELRADGFVSVANAEAEKQAQKVLSRIDAALRSKDKKVRESIVTDALALGPAAAGAVASRFQRLLDKEIETLDKSPLRKQIDKLDAQRTHLDAARTAAKALIYDETKYFYPYKPPQVEADRYAEYVRVQAEVNRLVDVVRADWNDERIKVKVPANIADSIERLDWISTVLRDLAELDPLALVGVEWARALIPGESVSIRTYCKNFEERATRELWRKIDAYNDAMSEQIPRGDASLLRITNDYRAMFGHRPLALDLKVLIAARGHAQEMSKLGYFSHFSPTPGRKTPSDRMLLAGYTHGAGENIALTDGAEGAHLAWCQSSGHHRNLLSPNHTEAGMAGDGRYWVQNFGNGQGHEKAIEDAAKPR
ncbi:MAG: hypothetical protein RLZZ562_734 [Planctomycetota bacterium]